MHIKDRCLMAAVFLYADRRSGLKVYRGGGGHSLGQKEGLHEGKKAFDLLALCAAGNRRWSGDHDLRLCSRSGDDVQGGCRHV